MCDGPRIDGIGRYVHVMALGTVLYSVFSHLRTVRTVRYCINGVVHERRYGPWRPDLPTLYATVRTQTHIAVRHRKQQVTLDVNNLNLAWAWDTGVSAAVRGVRSRHRWSTVYPDGQLTDAVQLPDMPGQAYGHPPLVPTTHGPPVPHPWIHRLASHGPP